MIKAIIFDWGGVLGEDNNRFAARKLAPSYGCDRRELEQALFEEEEKYSRGEDASNYYRTISNMFEIPEALLKKTLNSVKPWEVFYLAKNLSEHYRVFILSNQMTPRTKSIKESNDLSFFEDTFFSDEMRIKKPDPEIYKKVLDKIKLEAKECLFIDDKEDNIEAANNIGMKTILFQDIDQLKQTLRSLGISE